MENGSRIPQTVQVVTHILPNTVHQPICCISRRLKNVNTRPDVNIRPDLSTNGLSQGILHIDL